MRKKVLTIWLLGGWLFPSQEHSSVSVLVWLKGVFWRPSEGEHAGASAAWWSSLALCGGLPVHHHVQQGGKTPSSDSTRSPANLELLMCSGWMDGWGRKAQRHDFHLGRLLDGAPRRNDSAAPQRLSGGKFCWVISYAIFFSNAEACSEYSSGLNMLLLLLWAIRWRSLNKTATKSSVGICCWWLL